ncbi:MAG: outer rane-specific lipoprotein transporter subunit [Pseudomonadota bacterium]|jgi:lipoprotein-releasing system permease protein
MIMNLTLLSFELSIAWRYVRSARKYNSKNTIGITTKKNSPANQPFVSFISMLSMLGIALGVTALIVIMSVMNGFQKEVRSKMLSVISHIEILDLNGGMPDWQTTIKAVQQNPEVIGTAPYVQGQAMILRGEHMKGVMLRGILPALEPQVSDLVKLSATQSNLTLNTNHNINFNINKDNAQVSLNALKAGQFSIFLGKELAKNLEVEVGDAVNLLVPSNASTPIGLLPRTRKFTVLGTFESGHYEYDSTVALLHLDDAAKLLSIDTASGIKVKIKHMDDAPQIAQELARLMPPNRLVKDWSQANRTWFAAVQVEKRMMFIILTLIIAVAAFNLVSMLVMTVTDKQGQIAILRTLGATPASIRRIFMIQGFIVGTSGLIIGLVIGILLALNLSTITEAIEHLFGFQFLPREVYFISALPSDLRWADVTWVAALSLFLALIATIYPSAKAASINPVEALRYE